MSCWKSHLVVLAAGVGLPITFAGKMYIYDFTQLLLFTACLVVLYQRRWSWFYPVYLLACINKETSILAALVLLCWRGREALKPPYLWHLLAQVAIGFSVCLIIGYIFRNNPGTALEWHLQRNVNLSITALGKLRLLVLILAVVFSFLGSGRAPLFWKRGLAATLPVLLCASFFFGYVDELRDYYEALPFVVGLTLLAVGKSANIWPRSSCGVDGTVNHWPQDVA
jgi:hypothetical protein